MLKFFVCAILALGLLLTTTEESLRGAAGVTTDNSTKTSTGINKTIIKSPGAEEKTIHIFLHRGAASNNSAIVGVTVKAPVQKPTTSAPPKTTTTNQSSPATTMPPPTTTNQSTPATTMPPPTTTNQSTPATTMPPPTTTNQSTPATTMPPPTTTNQSTPATTMPPPTTTNQSTPAIGQAPSTGVSTKALFNFFPFCTGSTCTALNIYGSVVNTAGVNVYAPFIIFVYNYNKVINKISLLTKFPGWKASGSGKFFSIYSGSYKVVAKTCTSSSQNSCSPINPPDYSTSSGTATVCSGTAPGGGTAIKCTFKIIYTPSSVSTTTLKVVTKVDGGTYHSSDFTITVSGNSPSPSKFAGSSSGTSVTLQSGNFPYSVTASHISGYTTSYSSKCSDTVTATTAFGKPIKCTVTKKYIPSPPPPPPVSPTSLNVVTNVNNTNGGTKQPSDFTITVSENSLSPRTFPGSSLGTLVTLQSGTYNVSAAYVSGYTTTYSPECSGTASGGIAITCTVTNKYTPSPVSTTILNVVTNVDNTNGGTKQPSDFTVTVSGNSSSPRTFSGSSNGTSVSLHSGSYKVVANSMPDYSTSYSPQCSGIASIGGIPIKCTVTDQYTPPPPASANAPWILVIAAVVIAAVAVVVVARMRSRKYSLTPSKRKS